MTALPETNSASREEDPLQKLPSRTRLARPWLVMAIVCLITASAFVHIILSGVLTLVLIGLIAVIGYGVADLIKKEHT